LFNRTSRQLSLTDFSLSMAAKASDLYRQAEEVESEAQDLSVQPRGQVRLAIPMSFGLR
jgi:DNA-binding transcriptional LysR family regulator